VNSPGFDKFFSGAMGHEPFDCQHRFMRDAFSTTSHVVMELSGFTI
jgi:hypothetical protein